MIEPEKRLDGTAIILERAFYVKETLKVSRTFRVFGVGSVGDQLAVCRGKFNFAKSGIPG